MAERRRRGTRSIPAPSPSVALRLVGVAALLVLMFATSWYGISTPAGNSFGAAGSRAVHAWGTLTIVRWVLLAAAVATAVSLVLPTRALADLALGVGLLATVLLFYRLLIVLPDPHAILDVKLGGYLALVACAALTLGAYEAEVGGPLAQRSPRPSPGAPGAPGID